MNVGLPGTGIGGVFYLLSALCMPVAELTRRTRWRLVARQAAMAVGIGAGIWLTGWLLGSILAASPLLAAALQGAGINGRVAANVLRTATLAISLATLALVIVTVWVAKVVVHGWGAPAVGVRRRLRLVRLRKRPAIRKDAAA